MPGRAALYDRLSHETQENNNSVQTQQDKQYEYCFRNGYIVKEEYVFIETYGGVNTWRERPVLQKLLAVARNHEIDVVVVYHSDRLARGDDFIVLWHEFLHY